QWLAARLERFTLPRANGVVCISRYTQAAVSDLARKTWIVPNAVDASFFDVVRKPSPPSTVLCVGHVTVRKNQIEFIRALEPLAARQALRVLFLGGVVPEDAYCAQFLEMLKTRPWCVYGGVADRAQLKAHLSEAALLALPSLEDNCPMVVLEAMAAGVPVVAARVGGVPELVEEGQTGFFCDPLKDSSMRAAVEKALTHPPESHSMARRAKAQAKERFSPRVIAQHHLKIYREVLALR